MDTEQLSIDFPPPPRATIPGQDDDQPFVYGDICPPNARGCTIATDEWRYLKDSTGKQVGYVQRVKGRPVKDIAADIDGALRDFPALYEEIEWTTLGQGYKYKQGSDTPDTECPRHNGLVVYYTHGGSEGHLVNVDMRIVPEHGDGTYMIHKKLFMVKTLMGREHAHNITEKLLELLGVAD